MPRSRHLPCPGTWGLGETEQVRLCLRTGSKGENSPSRSPGALQNLLITALRCPGGTKGLLEYVRIILERRPRWFLHSASMLVILARNRVANEFPTKT